MELADSTQIANLLSRFATLADVGTLDEIAGTLADDVIWNMAGTTWAGRDAVVAGLRQLREAGHAGPGTNTRHLVTNLQIEPDGANAVRAHSYFIFLAAGSPPAVHLFGEYRDTLRKEHGGWRIASRHIVI